MHLRKITRTSWRETLLQIPPGESTTLKSNHRELSAVRTALSRFNREGYKFTSRILEDNETLEITRIK